MRLKAYLQQITPLLSNPEAVRQQLRLLALVLSVGILGGTYNFLSFTFNTNISQRHGYMSSAIAEAHTFFSSRETLLESLSLSTIRENAHGIAPLLMATDGQVYLQLGDRSGERWGIWLTQRMCSYLQAKHLNLLYVDSDPQARTRWLYNAADQASAPSSELLVRLHEARPSTGRPTVQWLAEQGSHSSFLYIFLHLDPSDSKSGWLGLEINRREISPWLEDTRSGEFMMFNADSTLVFTNSLNPELSQSLTTHLGGDFFGFVGKSFRSSYLVITKPLMSSEWNLVYAIKLSEILAKLWPQLLGALFFCTVSITLILVLILRFEQRFLVPTLRRIRALVESEMFSRDVIETAPVALCVLRRSDGQVVLENQLAQQWLGQDQARDSHNAKWIKQVFESQESQNSDYFESAKGLHLHLSCSPTRYKGEQVLLCAFSDISAQKQIEAALEDARHAADSANEAKTQFLATMSHEIRTPLYGVLGTLELLARTTLDAQQRDYLQAIEGSSSTLLQLICDVLDVSKIEAGQLSLELSEFSVLDLVHETIQGYSAAARSKGLQLYSCLDPRLPEHVIGDVNRIRQILNNLLSNAVKFTDCGRVVLRTRLYNRDGERSCLLWQVSDTGKGIAEQDQPFIFDPFYQTKSHTQIIPGTGLGLSICQRLTQLMNGQLHLVSDQGLGSSFSLTLPLEVAPSRTTAPLNLLAERIHVVSPVRELADAISGWLCRWGARAQVGALTPDSAQSGELLVELHPGSVERWLVDKWSGPRILASSHGCWEAQHEAGHWQVNLNDMNALHHAIVQAQGLHHAQNETVAAPCAPQPLGLHVLVAEDNVINQLILRDQLEELGCSVFLASNGEQALQGWQREHFDLVLTDVNMPGINGYELARALRRLGCAHPIIGATANALRGEEELCLAAGMDRCLIKPFNLQALFNCLAPYRGSCFEDL
ncbi:TPA: response regulator [Pseudomonas aeruginosa]|nr:response regulator [Pseudomonas aeruginosa]